MARHNPKSMFNARLHAEGRHELYIKFREAVRQLLIGKVQDRDIWSLVSFNFLPLDGSQHEVPLTRFLRDLLEDTGAGDILRANKFSVPSFDALDATTSQYAPLPPESGVVEPGPWLDGDPQDWATIIESPPAATELPAESPPPIVPPELPKSDSGWTMYARNVLGNATKSQERIAQRDEVWAKLAYSMDSTKRCPILETAEWIYHHLGTPPELIRMEDVPSPGALSHLRMLQEDPGAAKEFLKTWMVKTIPDKRQMEFDGKKRLGSVNVFKNLDAFDEQFAKEQGVKVAA